jgi:hypothetical protein
MIAIVPVILDAAWTYREAKMGVNGSFPEFKGTKPRKYWFLHWTD